MDSHPKVMTVSYGTFSCTLDGFNDPFTTMQLVAEYFRKLSADDRYFGSEPLQPDASKLHQIAMSANPNRVDAEVSENSVILRQADIVDVPSKVNTVDTVSPAQPAQDTVTKDTKAEFSTCRTTKTTETPVETDMATATDTLVTALDENVKDIATADELAPTLEEEIPSETVSAALQSLKGGEPINRWLETANEKMATPEHVSKANALERLKAAVAATEAERATRMQNMASDVTIETGNERRDNTISFRRELAKVRKAYDREANIFARPKARSKQTNGNSRPLVLDMGQRIGHSQHASENNDLDQVKKKISLTLVSDQKTLTHAKTSKSKLPSYDAFTQIMGAGTLIELLEASAAYMTLVLGQEQYTEEQISGNLPDHIKATIKKQDRIATVKRLVKREFLNVTGDGHYTISNDRKAAYQKKYLAG